MELVNLEHFGKLFSNDETGISGGWIYEGGGDLE